MSNVKKIFPIKQGVACQLKWTWHSLSFYEGVSSSCHRVKSVPLNKDNFDNFHNHPNWIEQRKLQLSGIFPDQGCQYCGDVEKDGGTSDRMVQNEVEGVYPSELDTEPLATFVTPRMLEVYFDNSCNLSCLYCSESNSSRIEKENIKFGRLIPGIPDQSNLVNTTKEYIGSKNKDELTNLFFDYLEKNYSTLRRLQVLGGEPLYQKQFFRLLEFLKIKKNPDLVLSIQSNLMVSKKVLNTVIQELKILVKQRKIKRFDVTASLDGDGQSEEVVRFGLSLKQWKDNFELLCKNKWIYLSINSTITSLNIPNLPALLDYISNRSEEMQRQINYEFGMVIGNDILHPKIFPHGFFDNYFENILSKMNSRTVREQKLVEHMKSIQNTVNNSGENKEHQYYLKKFLEEFDRRRNTNWKLHFPHLVDKLENLEI